MTPRMDYTRPCSAPLRLKLGGQGLDQRAGPRQREVGTERHHGPGTRALGRHIIKLRPGCLKTRAPRAAADMALLPAAQGNTGPGGPGPPR